MPPEYKGKRLGNCQRAPTCTLYADRGFKEVIGWANLSQAVEITDEQDMYMECHPHSSCLNNGGWTNIFFTTFISSALYPGGVTWSLFSTFYNGDILPPPPSPPPSPSPPNPPPNCPAFLPPPCLSWFSSTNNCCMAAAQSTSLLKQLLAAIQASSNFTELKTKVRHIVMLTCWIINNNIVI